MKKFRFNYYGQSITRKKFESVAPNDWQDNLNEYGEFSWGGYRAILID